MKAHRVKCAMCANGVTVVTALPLGEYEDPSVFVFAGRLTDEQAEDKAANEIAKEQESIRESLLGEYDTQVVVSPSDIIAGYSFHGVYVQVIGQ